MLAQDAARGSNELVEWEPFGDESRHLAPFENHDPGERERVVKHRSKPLHRDADGRRHRAAGGCAHETESAKERPCPCRQRGAGGRRGLCDVRVEAEPSREGAAPVRADENVVIPEHARSGSGGARDERALTAPRTAQQKQDSSLRRNGCRGQEDVSRARRGQGQERFDDVPLKE